MKKSKLQKGDIHFSFFERLQSVETDHRSLVLVTHGFVELLINAIVDHKCKHGRKITSNTRDYPHAVKLVLLYELGLIDVRLYKILDWFRSLRNRAAHDPFFSLDAGDFQFLRGSMDRFIPERSAGNEPSRFCMYLIGSIWNMHLDLMQETFYRDSGKG